MLWFGHPGRMDDGPNETSLKIKQVVRKHPNLCRVVLHYIALSTCEKIRHTRGFSTVLSTAYGCCWNLYVQTQCIFEHKPPGANVAEGPLTP